MDNEQILKILEKTTDYKEDLKEKYEQLISIAINFIKSKLKNKREENNEILTMLCASLVHLWITAQICANSPSGSFAGNGYKIKKNSKKQLEIAKKLFENWRAIAASLLVDEGFSFFSTKEYCKKWMLKMKLKKHCFALENQQN